VQVPWPPVGDVEAVSALACDTFRHAVRHSPFRISRAVLALLYVSTSCLHCKTVTLHACTPTAATPPLPARVVVAVPTTGPRRPPHPLLSRRFSALCAANNRRRQAGSSR
jgi:hypothetical protein